MDIDTTLVQYEHLEPSIAIVRINNPPVNALSLAVIRELDGHLREIDSDKSIRAVIVTASGERLFCGGADIREFPTKRGEGMTRARQRHALYDLIEELRQPVVAALNGDAYGGGLELAMACDLRVAPDDIKMGLREIRFGIFPAGGGTQRLCKLVGEARAKDLIYLSRVLTSQEAMTVGLVNFVSSRSTFTKAVRDLAYDLASQPSIAIQAAKRAIRIGARQGMIAGLTAEAELIDEVFLSQDAQEGKAAFMEKRQPEFQHC